MALNPYTAAGAATSGAAAAPVAGWQGLGGLLSFLQGGVNQSQQTNMVAGAQGNGFGAIGGAHGAAMGLSPWAMSYLAQNLLTKNAPAQQALTDADGNPLTGAALQMAQLQNGLSSNASPTYSAGQDVTTDMLSQLLNTFQTDTGHSAYAKGYSATGGPVQATPGGGPAGGPPSHPAAPHVYGHGLHGGDFHSLAAWHASQAYHIGRLTGKYGPGEQSGPVTRRNPALPDRTHGGTGPGKTGSPRKGL